MALYALAGWGVAAESAAEGGCGADFESDMVVIGGTCNCEELC